MEGKLPRAQMTLFGPDVVCLQPFSALSDVAVAVVAVDKVEKAVVSGRGKEVALLMVVVDLM
jgi:hypothetical protein